MSRALSSPVLVDTTLRDGEQTAGVRFSVQTKVAIAHMLVATGVTEIEAGTPIMGRDESQAISAIVRAGLGARIIGWCRALQEDIDAAVDCGVDAVAISLPLSDLHIYGKLARDREWVLEQGARMVAYAKSRGLFVIAGGEDSSRADQGFVMEYAGSVRNSGADRFRYCDTVGVTDPLSFAASVGVLVAGSGIPIEVHAHDDLGMASANTVCAIKSGAVAADVTVGGLGERAGNAALEEVAMALEESGEADGLVRRGHLRPLARLVAHASGREVPPWKSVVGDRIFHHESGIHVDGMLKDHRTYSPFDPADLGLTHSFVPGKHSGTSMLRAQVG